MHVHVYEMLMQTIHSTLFKFNPWTRLKLWLESKYFGFIKSINQVRDAAHGPLDKIFIKYIISEINYDNFATLATFSYTDTMLNSKHLSLDQSSRYASPFENSFRQHEPLHNRLILPISCGI